jgi:anti-sigma B factor antagonist
MLGSGFGEQPEASTSARIGQVSPPSAPNDLLGARSAHGAVLGGLTAMATGSDEDRHAHADVRRGHGVGDENASFFLQGLDGSTIVIAAGEIDMATAPALRTALIDAAGVSSKVVVDLSAVTFLDSTGLSVLMDGFKKLSARGSMCLVGPTGMVAKVFRVTRLDEVIPIHPDVEAALSASNET